MKKIVLFIVLCVLSSAIFAKGGGFGSTSFRSSGSSSGARVAIGSPKVAFKPSFKFGSTTASANKAPSTLFAKFKETNTNIAPNKRIVAGDLNKMFDRTYRTNRRASYYSGYTAPSYAQPMIAQHSSYGAFDALMMWSILDNMGDRKMYYNHQNDQGFQQWRADANQLCVNGNTDVCNKLEELDKDVNDLKAAGNKQDPTYITDGVDPGIYIADGVSAKEMGEIKICTGTQSSDYTRFALKLADSTKLNIKTVVTNGSIDNLTKMAQGSCDMAFAQEDALGSKDLVTVLDFDIKEQAILLCNTKSNIKTVKDLTDKNKIYVGSDQTGSLFTYNALINNKVGGIDKALLDTSKAAIMASVTIESEDNSCLFVVDTADAPYIKQMAVSGKTKIVAFNDKVDGYSQSYVDDDLYKSLTNDKYASWLGLWSKGTPVLTVKPLLVTTSRWVQDNPAILYDVLMINKQFLKKDIK